MSQASGRKTIAERLPSIPCPICKGSMRFTVAEPFDDKAMRLTFECWCGFKCHMPEETVTKLAETDS